MSHICPTCQSTLHTNGPITACNTADGRVILEAASSKPTDQRWLELPGNAQNWLAEILHQAQQQAKQHRP